MEPTATGAGIGASLRTLGATLLEIVGTRAELAVVELREEGERRKRMLVLALAGAVFAVLGLQLVTFFIVVAFWDTYRLPALGIAALVHLGIAAAAFLRLQWTARHSPPAFDATLREFQADLEWVKGRDG